MRGLQEKRVFCGNWKNIGKGKEVGLSKKYVYIAARNGDILDIIKKLGREYKKRKNVTILVRKKKLRVEEFKINKYTSSRNGNIFGWVNKLRGRGGGSK